MSFAVIIYIVLCMIRLDFMAKAVRKKYKLSKKKRRMWFKRIRFLLILAAIVFLVVSVRNYVSLNPELSDSKPAKAITGSTSALQRDTKKTESLKTALNQYLSTLKGHYGIYYYNLYTGDELGINESDEFTAASTIKVPLNVMLYEKILNGEINPNSTLKYIEEDYEEGTGIIQTEQFGKIYSIKELSRLSIAKSDNVATNMLLRFFGRWNLKSYMRETGAAVVDDTRNISCPKDMGLFMEKVYELCKDNNEITNSLMDSLLNTDFNDRIPAKLPKNVKVAHKIGTQVGVVNDVGIVFADRPYIIAIMSKDVVEADAVNSLAEISRIIYEFQSSIQ